MVRQVGIFVVSVLSTLTAGCGSDAKKAQAPGSGTMAMDECGLHTAYKGDENCILPPPPDKGFQLHVGPTDYDNPEATYVLDPGAGDSTQLYSVVSGNDHDVFFFYRQYRMRPSGHHAIMYLTNETNVGPSVTALPFTVEGRRIGTMNRSEDYPAGGVLAPEDAHVGLPLAANSAVSVSFHAINAGDTPELRELWVNFWYRDPNVVTEQAIEWFRVGDLSFDIPPHTQQTLGPYTCDVDGPGRLLWLYGHRHANNLTFTGTRIRGTQRDTIYFGNKWEEPVLLEYSSIVKNPTPDIANGVQGGWNGILDLAAGDKIEWTCDVMNNHDTDLRFTNQTYLGEMCIIDAEAIGSNCTGF